MPLGVDDREYYLRLAEAASNASRYSSFLHRAGLSLTFLRINALYHLPAVTLDIVERSGNTYKALAWLCARGLFDELNWEVTKLGQRVIKLYVKWHSKEALRYRPNDLDRAADYQEEQRSIDPELRLIQDMWSEKERLERLPPGCLAQAWEVPLIHLDSDLEVALQHPPALGSLRAQVRRAKIRRNNCGTYRWFPLIEETDDWFDDVIKNIENSLERACGLDD